MYEYPDIHAFHGGAWQLPDTQQSQTLGRNGADAVTASGTCCSGACHAVDREEIIDLHTTWSWLP